LLLLLLPFGYPVPLPRKELGTFLDAVIPPDLKVDLAACVAGPYP